MEQNEQNGGTTGTDQGGTTADVLTMDQVKAMIQAAVTENERKWSSKFDRLNTDYTKLKHEKMTVEERAAAEIEEQRKALEEERAAFQAEKLRADRLAALSGKGLPADLADYVGGDDAETIGKRADALKQIIDTEVAKQVQIKMFGSVQEPVQGDPIDPSDDQAYMRAAERKRLSGAA